MAETRKPNEQVLQDTTGPRNVNAPDLGGSFEENGQVRRHDGVGAGPGMEVLDEGLRAAQDAERNSSAGS
jgi:hypothetical protein